MDKNLLTETILTTNSISDCETYVLASQIGAAIGAIAKSVVTWLGTGALLLIGVVMTMVTYEGGLIIVHPVSAQTNSTTTITGNMTILMMDLASFHLKMADDLLTGGNIEAALDQINPAEIQLSLLNMDSQKTAINQT
jgi:hypothetical protein